VTDINAKIDKASSTIERLNALATLSDNQTAQLERTNKDLQKFTTQLFSANDKWLSVSSALNTIERAF
jgi:ABC-type transporter Mla subunit MlaD